MKRRALKGSTNKRIKSKEKTKTIHLRALHICPNLKWHRLFLNNTNRG